MPLSPTTTLLNRTLRTTARYPYQIEHHRLPWKCLPPRSPDIHQHAAGSYFQLLDLARRVTVPLLLQDFHPEFEEPQGNVNNDDNSNNTNNNNSHSNNHNSPMNPKTIQHLLPGMVYLLPEVRTLLGPNPNEWGPPHWTGTPLPTTDYLMHYGRLSARIAAVFELYAFVSPDLTLLCNAVCLQTPHGHCCPGSSLGGLVKERKDAVLFHYYRPNRPAWELLKPLERYWGVNTRPCLCGWVEGGGRNTTDPTTQDRRGGLQNTGLLPETVFETGHWDPVPVPVRAAGEKAAPMRCEVNRTVASDSWWSGIPEREGAIPGHCFGKRKNAWGMGF